MGWLPQNCSSKKVPMPSSRGAAGRNSTRPGKQSALMRRMFREGVRRIAEGNSSDIVIDAIGGDVLRKRLAHLRSAEVSRRWAINRIGQTDSWRGRFL